MKSNNVENKAANSSIFKVSRNCRGYVLSKQENLTLEGLRKNAEMGEVLVTLPGYERAARIKCPRAFYEENGQIKVCVNACLRRGLREHFCSADYAKCATVNPDVRDHEKMGHKPGYRAKYYSLQREERRMLEMLEAGRDYA